MELVEYDKDTDEMVVRVKGNQWNRLVDMVSGVCSIYDRLDETILGLNEREAKQLCDGLVFVLRKANQRIVEKDDG